MRPRFRRDMALSLLLNTVVTHGSGGVQALGYLSVRHRLQIAGISGVLHPDARKAVGLKLRLHGSTLWPGITPTGRRVEHTGQVLDVVAIFVRYHIPLGERAAL